MNIPISVAGLLFLSFFGALGLAKEAIPVICTDGMTPVQNNWPVTSNGCTGAEFIELDGEEDFTSCCDEHDACYQVCGMGKRKCDYKFWECMEHMCESVFSENKKCKKAANIYYLGTSTLGTAFYEDAQSEHCMCVDNKDVTGHYKNLIDAFYTKHAPKSKSKFDWSKYEKFSASKFSMLYNTLHEKYHASIEHEGSRVGLEPPRSKTRPLKKAEPWGDSMPEVLAKKEREKTTKGVEMEL